MTDLRVATVGGRPITLSTRRRSTRRLATGAAWPRHRTERRGGFAGPASLGRPGARQRGGPRTRGSGGGDRGGRRGRRFSVRRHAADSATQSPGSWSRRPASVTRQHAGRAVLLRPEPRPLSHAGDATRPARPGARRGLGTSSRSAPRRRRRHGGARGGRLHRSGEPEPGRTARRGPSRRIRRSARGWDLRRRGRRGGRPDPDRARLARGAGGRRDTGVVRAVPCRTPGDRGRSSRRPAHDRVLHMARRAARGSSRSSSPDTSTRRSQDTDSRATGIEETTLSETRATGGNGRRR